MASFHCNSNHFITYLCFFHGYAISLPTFPCVALCVKIHQHVCHINKHFKILSFSNLQNIVYTIQCTFLYMLDLSYDFLKISIVINYSFKILFYIKWWNALKAFAVLQYDICSFTSGTFSKIHNAYSNLHVPSQKYFSLIFYFTYKPLFKYKNLLCIIIQIVEDL